MYWFLRVCSCMVGVMVLHNWSCMALPADQCTQTSPGSACYYSKMTSSALKIQTLRSLIRELRRSLPEHETLKHSPAFSYIIDQYRRNALTDQQYCREQEEMAHLAQTCATYLESSRKYMELYSEYYSHGEKTVKETADMVGFKLPNDPYKDV